MSVVATCTRCGNPYWKNAAHAEYCPDCRVIVRSEKRKENRIKTRQLSMGHYGRNAQEILADKRRAEQCLLHSHGMKS